MTPRKGAKRRHEDDDKGSRAGSRQAKRREATYETYEEAMDGELNQLGKADVPIRWSRS